MAKKSMGNELIHAMEEAVEYMQGEHKKSVTYRIEVPDNIDVPRIRKRMKLTRMEFANKTGFSYKTIQHWERGDRRPSGPARILLAILEKEPNVINKYLYNARASNKLKSKKVTHGGGKKTA